MKQMNLICEARLNLTEKTASGEPTGKIEARITSWGPREGADGRRFNYQPEGFMDWAEQFASSGRPLPMFLNHNAESMPVGELTSIEIDD
jgi:hypothetical protein